MTTISNTTSEYWVRDIKNATTPRLRRSCQWSDSMQWRALHKTTLASVSKLSSPLLLIPENTDEALAGTYILPEGYWISVPEADYCKKWTVEQIDCIMLDIARGVRLLNLAGLVAADLNPANVLIDDSDERPRAALSDFSSCLPLRTPLKPCDLCFSAPEYAAPEAQAYLVNGGVLTLDLRADMFSLGLLYHVFLTGKMPIFDESTGKAAGIPTGRARLSNKLDQPHHRLIRRMLEIERSHRMSSATVLAHEINKILSSGYCYIELSWPGHEGETLMLSSDDSFLSRRRMSKKGIAIFGPLLSSDTYWLSIEKKEIVPITFPSQKSGQRLFLDITPLLVSKQDLAEDANDTEIILLEPPVNYICRIEILSEHYCLLTLINGGTIRIRKTHAGQYGVGDVLKTTGR